MKIYFLSSQPCALKLGGVYFGRTDSFARSANINPADGVFVEFIPETAQPIAFYLTDAIRDTPPSHCEIYLLRDAIAVYANDFPPRDFTLRPIAQIVDNDRRATLFQQGKIQLCLQTQENFVIATLPPPFAQAELIFSGDFLLVKSPTMLAVLNKNGEILFQETVLSYLLENERLYVRMPLHESLGRYADCTYLLSENSCVRTECKLGQARCERPESFLAYAFFESILLGGDIRPLLADDLQEKAESLIEFLGEFTAVLPTDDETCCGLIKRKKERVFEAEYYSVRIENGKISDITT